MPDTYTKQDVESFRATILSFKKYEEDNLTLENSIPNKTLTSSVTRKVFIHAYEHILELLDNHFELEAEEVKTVKSTIVKEEEDDLIYFDELPDDLDDEPIDEHTQRMNEWGRSMREGK